MPTEELIENRHWRDIKMNRCSQCNIETEQVKCPGCNLFLTTDPAIIEAHLPEPKIPSGSITYATIFGNWGDCMVAVCNTKWMLAQAGKKKVRALYWGLDDNLARFIAAQSCFSGVCHARPLHRQEYDSAYSASNRGDMNYERMEDWLELIRSRTDEKITGRIFGAHVGFYGIAGTRCKVSTDLELPPDAIELAHIRMSAITKDINTDQKIVMLHPVSNASEPVNWQWGMWPEAVEWLLSSTKDIYILTGRVDMPGMPSHPRLVNMIGQTPDYNEVLALTSLCDSVITTGNSVACWCTSTGKPAMICGNLSMRFQENHYARFLNREPNLWLNLNEPLSKFKQLATKYLGL